MTHNPKYTSDFYAQLLGIQPPWFVEEVFLEEDEGRVIVQVDHDRRSYSCPKCGVAVTRYDYRGRRWRHLDSCEYETILAANVPRVQCPEHGVIQLEVPWAEAGSGFTALFEAKVIAWLQESSIEAVRRQLGLSWSAVDTIMKRAVARGLSRQEARSVRRIGVDETSYKKGQKYLTIVTDLEEGKVLYVDQERTAQSLAGFYESLPNGSLEQIEAVAMDMWKPYIQATENHVPEADRKICFDKFHVAQHLGNAIDRVRRQEHKALRRQGNEILSGTKQLWRQNPKNMSDNVWGGAFQELRQSRLKTARAWAIREEAMGLWHYLSRAWARKAWNRWYSWAIRSRLEPVKQTARTIKRHLEGILNAIVCKVTNAGAESMNARIQKLKRRAHGFRSVERLKTVIYFHFGGLDLLPVTHTNP